MSKDIKLVLGPSLFNWKVEDYRDYYYKIADTDIDEVYIGETVCLRRDPFYKEIQEEIADLLTKKGKQVIFSTIQLILGQPEFKRAEDLINAHPNNLVEVNDINVLSLVKGRNFVAGPTFNNYNEETLSTLEEKGAVRFSFPFELDKNSLQILAKKTTKDCEFQVFGKIPLAISARCYHARLHDKPKIDCEYVCNLDYNGKLVKTMTNEDFLTINGTQTMSYTYNNLVMELDELKEIGINCFRLSPHYLDMPEVIRIFKAVLQNKLDKSEAFSKLLKLLPKGEKFSNGFYYGNKGKHYDGRFLNEEKPIE
ncbi:U32 family peptidase [Rickettsiales bacterium LUAb2]